MELKLKEKYGELENYILLNQSSYIDAITAKNKNDLRFLPTLDIVFKHMFSEEEVKRNACLLLNTVLAIEVDEIEKKMMLIRNELGALNYKASSVRLDFVAKVEDVIFNIEMNQKNELERNIDYANRLYLEVKKKSKKKTVKKYRFVFQININNFTIKGIEESIKISVMGTKGMRSKIIIVDIFLPMINKKYREGKILSEEEKTLLWMFIGNEEDMRKLGGENEDMKKYLERLKKFALKNVKVKEYYEERDSVLAGREMGREEGLEQGLEQGRQETQIETATIMLRKGLEPKLVQECTKLPFEKIMNIMSLL